MNTFARIAVLGTLGAGACGTPVTVAAMQAWMSEAAMRAAFIGKTLDGHYVDGLT
jgi:hypothetical protein